jgi:hypothetical protein
MTIATDLRAEMARILARHFNSGIPDAIAAIRVSTVARIDAYVTEAEDRAAACTCREPEAFNPFRRETRLDYSLKLARFKRMAAEEGRA